MRNGACGREGSRDPLERAKIEPKSIKKSSQGAFGAIWDDSGWLRDAPVTLRGTLGTPRDALGTLPGHSREASGRPRDAVGTLRDSPRMPSGRLGTALLQSSLAEPFLHRCGLVFPMIFGDFSIVSQTVCRSLRDRFSDVFSIGFRSFLRSKPSSHAGRSIIAEH